MQPNTTNILSNKPLLEQINPNFHTLISQIHQLHSSAPLNRLPIDPQLLNLFQSPQDFLTEFNNSDQKSQINLLSNLPTLSEILSFITSDPSSYTSTTFLDELYFLAKKDSAIKCHISFYIRDFLLTLGVSYSDEVRAKLFRIILLLLNEKNPEDKLKITGLNKLIYEPLYDFDIYYDAIKSVTSESVILSLTPEEVDGLIQGQLSENLHKQIEKGIQQLGGSAFFKMHRSPKDCFSQIDKVINGAWVQYWGLNAEENPEKSFMRIRNAEQMILLCKYSERIQQDLKEFRTSVKTILRKWETLGTEFRCFVCNGQLNAVSGYGFNEEVDLNKRNHLEIYINSKEFIEIMTGIPYSHAVIDCGIGEEWRVKIIELNPFGKAASAAKFSWVVDKEILYNGYQINKGKVTLKT